VLVAFRDRDPNQNGKKDEIPLSFSTGQLGQTRSAFLAAFGILSRGYPFGVDENGKVFYIYTAPQYREYLTYMNRLFTEKLLDSECFTQTQQQFTAKGNQTLYGTFADLASYTVDNMDHFDFYTTIPPLVGGSNTKQMWPATYPIYFGQYSLTNKNKYPEASIRWVDYFFTYEGGHFLFVGPEDLWWSYKDGNRDWWGVNTVPAGFATNQEWRGTITHAGTRAPGHISEKLNGFNANPAIVWLEDEIKTAYLPFKQDTFPLIKLTADEQREAATLSTDIDKYAAQMEARFITGDAALSGWDNYIRDLTSMRVQRLTEIYQAAYSRYMNK
jgi:putative aldouronate transport system substrate-binding protein